MHPGCQATSEATRLPLHHGCGDQGRGSRILQCLLTQGPKGDRTLLSGTAALVGLGMK